MKGMAASSLARHVVASGLACELPPLFSLPLTSCRAAQAAFALGRQDRERRRHTLVLDIDETLVFTYNAAPSKDSRLIEYRMLLRPHLSDFLLEVERLFDLVFWTAGTASYCAAVLSGIQEAIGRTPSKCYASAPILAAAKDDLNSISVAAAQRQVLKDTLLSPEKGQAPLWPALSRSQTLQELDYMKYLPLLGIELSSVVMVDDHERSFPLAPRNGLKIARFAPYLKELPSVASDNGRATCVQVPSDDSLLRLLPILRRVAEAGDAQLELDHWRDEQYVACDDPLSMLNPLSHARRTILGSFVTSRRADPIAPLLNFATDDAPTQAMLKRVSEAALETIARTNQSRQWGILQSHI